MSQCTSTWHSLNLWTAVNLDLTLHVYWSEFSRPRSNCSMGLFTSFTHSNVMEYSRILRQRLHTRNCQPEMHGGNFGYLVMFLCHFINYVISWLHARLEIKFFSVVYIILSLQIVSSPSIIIFKESIVSPCAFINHSQLCHTHVG